MRVFACYANRYGRDAIPLGNMPVLPDREDRVTFNAPVPIPGGEGSTLVTVTVARRIFEIRAAPRGMDEELHDLPQRTEWVCLLTFLEST